MTPGADGRGAAPPLVELADVTIRLGGRVVLADVSAAIARGEFVGVIGPNGSGKTTLLQALLGLVRPAAGAVRPARRGNPRLGYCPQARAVDPDLPVKGRDFVGLGLDGHRWGVPLPSARRRARVERVLADAPLGRLSGGERQRLAIAQALVGAPALLLLDEPLAGLDVRSQRDIVALVDRLRREHDLAVLFVTHGVNPLLGVMDRVWYLAGGRAALGPVREVIRPEVLSRLYGAPVEVVEAAGRLFVASPDEWAERPREGAS